ncbi:60S acidic ribosomal protein P2 isoform X1 [Gasterosteus aculeatus]|uniref:60S acidic ribosomal protein P2 isoform X1 n=1 Tax=Gasterosteus aculeatus aculeatus TaxID=481459 RepID=UPI001A9A14D0|nr:60S acidic ribosomal protein P2 isoform X1 [Gasterosteus aculeatus aculeatus]
MRYVAAYLLAVLGGNTSPSSKDIKDILGSVGIEAEDERLNKVPHLTPYSAISKALDIFSAEVESSFSLQVISELNGKDINEVMNSGLSKLASVPAGGAVAAPAAAVAAAGAAPAVAEEKKEEKKEESEESDEDMGFGLFD